MNTWLILHIVLALCSYLAFLVACTSGTLFLVQERQLRLKRLGQLFHRIPSLAALDLLNLRAIALGFLMFTIGLVCGIAGRKETLNAWVSLDPKEALAYLTWVAYAVLLVIRLTGTLSHRKVAVLSILGFCLVLLTCFGIELFAPSWHSVVAS
jgi:ABC-type transport system involved in cytochrome c biogenesis permease subunit